MPLDDVNYDPLEDITTILSDKDTLNTIDDLISQTRAFKLQLENNIIEVENEELSDSVIGENYAERLFKVFEDFTASQKMASSTEYTITNLTQGIAHLDNAKRNITQSMTLFQNLKILFDSFLECKRLIKDNLFLEMVSPYKIMCSLTENTFNSHKSVGEISRLLLAISKLQSETLNKIKNIYTKLLNGGGAPDPSLALQLREGACELVDSDSNNKSQIIDWAVKKILYELEEIFQPDDEAGSLENLPRRYVFFKKVLTNFNNTLASSFLPSWNMPLSLTCRFFQITRKDLKLLLNKEFKNKQPSIDLFMTALQATIDFEKYIDVRFSNKCEEEKLSMCFEPFLSLWVSHQDRMMQDKMMSYMSESKISESPSESLVAPSSADLFRTYRSLLSQILELIGDNKNDKVLLSLATFFAKWLDAYMTKILSPLILPDNIEIQDKEEVIQYTVLLVNTSDYCSTTIDQLEEKLSEFTTAPQKISDTLSRTKDSYDNLLARANKLLLHRVIPMDLAYVWKEFNSTDWAHVLVEDYSRYMITLKNLISVRTTDRTPGTSNKSALESIIVRLNRDAYKWNFFDKVVDLIISNYVDSIVKLLQPLPPFATLNSKRQLTVKKVISVGEQLLLDIELLKEVFHNLLNHMAELTSSIHDMSAKRIKRRMDSSLELLLHFAKILVLPLDSPENYYNAYSRLTDNNSYSLIWAFIFSLKGTEWDLASWKEYWFAFKEKMAETSSTENENEADLFIFKGNSKHLTRFEANLGRIQETAWSDFVKTELHITVPRRVI
ncbi:hypothetical protein KAFR_0E01630 [Kazachstania africana CBS 2517]|uniref:Vps53 N-terminal domain-containing protein n=1 Tax=Kazachstania africana (strain ATCC 22294 / BCRC 22015 / CBS 2517 / CECT 1963 / NBRC 1671 / NRRL Y-8276) TaxID=1071382 RepID=H2AVB7_KAZAF|nr:hypothetical protein KAFR_0E01630 [Kazachstania africana CBS 2517]CCF58317.1 hypothetical protein KAFR_0E01630 [Kazachstania africana CBS 2517]